MAWILAEKGRTAGMAIKLTNAGSIQWPEVNRCTLISRLAKCKATGQGQYTSGNEKRAALLDYEKQNLLNEIKHRSDQGAPMSRTDMRRYIRSLLRVRKSQTMRHKSSYTAAATPLNDAAMNILNSEDVDKLQNVTLCARAVATRVQLQGCKCVTSAARFKRAFAKSKNVCRLGLPVRKRKQANRGPRCSCCT